MKIEQVHGLPISPAEAALDLHKLHVNTVGLRPEILGAGAIIASDLTTESGLLIPASALDTPSQPTDTSIEVEPTRGTEGDVMQQLSPEQIMEVDEIVTAAAEKLNVYVEDFSVLSLEIEDGAREFMVAYTADRGIDLGDPARFYDAARSWKSIRPGETNFDFEIEVDGRIVDVRNNVTLARLREVANSNPLINEWNWATGSPEMTDADFAPIVVLNDGQANGYRSHRDNCHDNLLFRPVVVLK